MIAATHSDYQPIVPGLDSFTPQTMNVAWQSIFLQKPREDRLPETAAARTQLNPLDEAQLDMTSYDEVISCTEQEASRTQLQSAMDKGRTMPCPIRILSPDILGEIFSLICLSDYSLKICRPKPFTKESLMSSPTLALTQVCSYWRCLVFSLPLLWSSLSIESWHLYGRPALADLVVTYISRSGNVPLKIHLKSEEDIPEVELQVFDALLEHVSRWREATLYISLPWLLHTKTKLGSRLFSGSTCFLKLEHLVLNVQRNSRSNQDLTKYFPNQIILSSPKLNVFHGIGYDSSFNPRGFGRTYNHSLVTKLVLHRFTGGSLGHFLSCFPMLETCSIGGFQLSEDASNDIGFEDDVPIYTSKITHLCHAAPWDTFQRGAWRFLRIPDLTSLELRSNGYSLTQVSSLLSSSGSVLSKVKLYNFPIDETISFLSSNPSISHLCIHVDGELGLLDQLTTGLTFVTDRWPVVPNLLSFELSWSDWGYKRLRDLNTMALQTVLGNTICGMVESRLSVSGSKTQGLQRLALRIRDGDFLEFELLYEAIGNKLSSTAGFDFETLTPQFSCVKTFR
ncbi:hypothetical protein C8J55DRAFT_112420 [Lentinula edodes]|uniref:F-box domain-containing protein n=1 Tax=Lentinula lateritia TaxID=40482 RepID=A0A9W9B0Y7_9AGAR|nr:hypothetical protein C8J55DRAFT_112420 [Lentinula edodes]